MIKLKGYPSTVNPTEQPKHFNRCVDEEEAKSHH